MGEQLGRREPAPSALDRPLASRLTWDHGADRGFPLRYRKGNSHRHPFLTAFSYLELVGDTQLGDQPSRRVASTPVSLAPSIAGRRPSPSSAAHRRLAVTHRHRALVAGTVRPLRPAPEARTPIFPRMRLA